MDEQHPPDTRDVPHFAAGFSSAVLEEPGQEENGTCAEEVGPTEFVVPPPSESLTLPRGPFGGFHLETRREWGPRGVVEDVRAEPGDNVLSDTGVGGISFPVNPDRNRSQDFQEQDTGVYSSGFVGLEDVSRTAADSPSKSLHDVANCEERRLAVSSDFEQGVLRDRSEVTVACLDLNVEEKPQEGTDLDHLHCASAGELDVREITEDANSMQVCLVQGEEYGNRPGSQCARSEAIEQLELNDKEREPVSVIDFVEHPIATEYSVQGKEMVSSESLYVEGDWKMGSSEVGYLEKNFFALPCSENIHVVDLNDELVGSSSQLYVSSFSGGGNDLQNRTYPLHTLSEPAAAQSEYSADSIGGQATSCSTVFVDAEEEVVEAGFRKAKPADVLGEQVLQIPGTSIASASGSMIGEQWMSKEEREKHRIQGNCAIEDVRPLVFNMEKSDDSQLIRSHVMEVETAKQASEEEENTPLSRPVVNFLEGSSCFDGQAGSATCAPGFSASLSPCVDDVEGKTSSGSRHEDFSRYTKQPASQLSEQHINQEITMEHFSRYTKQPASQLSEQHINQEITMEHDFTQDISRNIEQPVSQVSEKPINQPITGEQNFREEQDGVCQSDAEESAVELIDKKVNDQTSSQSSDGDIDKETSREQTVADECGRSFHMEEDESDTEPKDKQIDGKTLMQLAEDHIDLIDKQIDGKISMQFAEDHIDENAMNEKNAAEEHGGGFHMEEDLYSQELADKQPDDQASTEHSETHIDEETARKQNAAEEDGRFHMDESDSAAEPVDKQIDGKTLMQLAEDHIDENVINEEIAAEEHGGGFHMYGDVYSCELADKQPDDLASTEHSDKPIDEETAGEQNAAEEDSRFYMDEGDSVAEPVDKQIDGQSSTQLSEEYATEEIMNDQSAADENGGDSHIDEDELDLEVTDNQTDDLGSSQPSEERLDEEITEVQNSTEGHFGVLHMEKELAMELVNRQVEDETSMQLSEDHTHADVTRGQNDAEEHGGDLVLEDGKSVLCPILDKQMDDQIVTGKKVGDDCDGALLEAEQSTLGALKGEGSEEINKDEETFEPAGGEEEIVTEEHAAEQLSKVSKEGFKFGVGDLVWAKVKSHPWWPGQIFDPVDASAFAKKVRKPGRILVAFFGDCTFGWLQESQMIAFRPNFEEKVKQTNMKSFCKAVGEALDEVCRRAELGTSCSCHGGVVHSTGTFPDANTGIQKGVRIKHHPDILMSKAGFKSEKIQEFVKGVACSPFGLWSSSLEAAEIRGHVYGSRTGIHSMEKSDSDDLLQNVLIGGLRDRAGRLFSTPRQGLKLKRRFSSLETENGIVTESGKEAKKINIGNDGMLKQPSEGGLESLASRNATQVKETDAMVALEETVLEGGEVQGSKESTEDTVLGKGKRISFTKKFESSKKARRSGSDGEATESMVGKGAGEEKSSDDDAETLFALAGFHSKLLKKLGKGNGREVAVKSSTDVKSVSNVVVDREELGQTQEVKPSKKLLEVDKTVKESSVGQAKVLSNSSSPALAAQHLRRTSEQRTKFQNDVDPSLPKDAELLNDFIIVQAELNKKVLDREVFVKDQKNTEEPSVTMANSKNRQEVTVKGEKQSSIFRSKQETDVKKPSKAMKLGECIQRIAGELTGTPPITKSMDQNSTKKAVFDVSMKSGPKKEMRGSIPVSFGLSKNHKSPVNLPVDEKTRQNSVQLLQGLHFLARNPLNNVYSSKSLGGVMTTFLKFRDMVFQKSSGYGAAVSRSGEQSAGKTDVHLNNNDHVSDPKSIAPKLHPATQDLAPSTQKHGVQELALAARKRKSEVVQEGLAKMSKKGVVTSMLQGQHAVKAGTNAAKFTEQSHRSKHQKHHPSRAIFPTSDVKSPTRQSDDKLSSHSPVGLFMKFPQSFALPSEAQLKATFIRFGALQTAGTRVYRSNASAQVVFKHGRDAEVALKYAKENAIFGQAAVTFRLRHFSQPERVDSKQNTSPFGREKSLRGDGRLSSPTMERLHHVTKPSSLDRGERGRTGSTADLPVSHQLQATENPSNNNTSLNLSALIPNSASTANEPSGDIQDQMIKLLRQVSVIVSSSSLPTEAS